MQSGTSYRGAYGTRISLVLCSVTLFFSTACLAGNSSSADQLAAEQADALYADGEFSKAYNKYVRLAKKGDPFSQYRASYMHLTGEGVDVDYPTAFAWAVLAAESDDPKLFTYLEEVKARVPVDQRDKAQAKAETYTREWGRLALAIEARRKANRELRSCTGSRLGTRCDEVYALQMPKFWAINPGVGDGSDGGSASPSGSVSHASFGAGGETRDAEYYQKLRDYAAGLDQYIQNEAGEVTLGEFEVIEPESEAGKNPADGH